MTRASSTVKIKKPFSWNITEWTPKQFMVIFFRIDIIFYLLASISCICIYLYRPLDVVYTAIIFSSILVGVFFIYNIFKSSANKGEILFYYSITRMIFMGISTGWCIYQITKIGLLASQIVFGLARIFLLPFIFYIIVLLYSVMSLALSVMIFTIQVPRRDEIIKKQAVNEIENMHIDGIIEIIAHSAPYEDDDEPPNL